MQISIDAILVTTRDSRRGFTLTGPDNTIIVTSLKSPDAENFVQSLIKFTNNAGTDDLENLSGVVEVFVGTPLAMEQAAGYILAARMTPSNYIAKLDDTETEGDSLSRGFAGFKAQSVLEKNNDYDSSSQTKSNHLLQQLSFLGKDPIPGSLVRAINGTGAASAEAVDPLRCLSIISSYGLGDAFIVHNLVRLAVGRDSSLTGTRKFIQVELLVTTSQSFPSDRLASQIDVGLFVPHIIAVTNDVLEKQEVFLEGK